MADNTSSGKDFLSLLKAIGGAIAGGMGFAVSIIGFINLAIGNKGIVAITILCIGIGTVEIWLLQVYLKKRKPEESVIISSEASNRRRDWSYTKNKRRLALSFALIIPILVLVSARIDMPNRSAQKFVVLIANFDGPEQDKYRPTDILMKQIREATRKYSEIEIHPLGQSIAEQQGSVEARRIGEENKVSIVMWGWYGKTSSSVYLTIYFEILIGSKRVQKEMGSGARTLNVALADIESFKIQVNLSDEMSYLTLLITGLSRYEAEDYDGAIERFTDALNLPTNPKEIINPAVIYKYRGNSYLAKGNLDNGIVDYNKAISLNPDYDEAYYNRGYTYCKQGKYDLAIADCNKAISLKPDDADNYINRGRVYYEQGKYDLAIADCNKAISLKPDEADAYFNRGVAYCEKGEYDLTIADCSKAMSLKPDEADHYFRRGLAYCYQEKYDLAINDYNKAISLKPDADAYNNRGLAYCYQGKFDQGIADYSKAISLKLDLDLAYFNRGNAYSYQGKYDLAINDYNKAISLKPDNPEAYFNRGNAYYSQEKYDLAIEDYSKAISLKPDDSLAYNSRGLTYEHIGEHDKAKADFEKAEKLKQNNTQ